MRYVAGWEFWLGPVLGLGMVVGFGWLGCLSLLGLVFFNDFGLCFGSSFLVLAWGFVWFWSGWWFWAVRWLRAWLALATVFWGWLGGLGLLWLLCFFWWLGFGGLGKPCLG